jgi:hypothetical protein
MLIKCFNTRNVTEQGRPLQRETSIYGTMAIEMKLIKGATMSSKREIAFTFQILRSSD